MKRRSSATSYQPRPITTWSGRQVWHWRYDRRRGARLFAYAYYVPPGELSSDWLVWVREYGMKKPDVSQLADQIGAGVASGGTWKSMYPHLTEYLTTVQWEDGTPRAPSVLRIYTRGAGWWGEVQDANYQRVMRVEATVPQDVLKAVDALIDTSDAPWCPAPWLTPPKGKKKK